MKYKILVIVVLLIAFALSGFGINNIKPLKHKVNDVFPVSLNGWEGKNVKINESVYKMLDKEELLIRNYKNVKTGQELNLAIVLTNKRDHIHDPQICYRGQGISMDREVSLKLNEKDTVIKVLGSKHKKPYNIIYWYTDLNKTYSHRLDFMKQIILFKIFSKPANEFALVVITAPETNGGDKEFVKFAGDVNRILKDLN